MLRRIATAASTLVVAVVLALVVPVSQLYTASVVTECCCPDPDRCKCPDHDERPPVQATLQACHKTMPDSVAPVAPAFVPPQVESVRLPDVVALAPIVVIRQPHAAPAPRRPDAPS